MVVPGVLRNRNARLPSYSSRVSRLVTWEPDSGAGGPGKSSILVSNHNNLLSSSPFLHSHHISPLVCLFVAWEPDGGARGPGKLQGLVSHHNVLLSAFLQHGNKMVLRGVPRKSLVVVPIITPQTVYCRDSRFTQRTDSAARVWGNC